MTNQCKLILVEGIPGSGKTTQASYIKEILDSQGIPNRLYLEGNPEHPADFESVAHFTSLELENFIDQHHGFRQWLQQAVTTRDDDYFISYGRPHSPIPRKAFDDMLADLAKHDVYALNQPQTFQRLTLDRWWDFVDEASHRDEVTILECAFLQNPLTALLGKYNLPPCESRQHLEQLAAIVRPLHPILIYLQTDVRRALEQAAQQRPADWRDFVIQYLTSQGWGKATGLNGYEGVIAFYQMRNQVELDILSRLDMDQLQLNLCEHDWPEIQKRIGNFVLAALGRP